MLPQPYDDELIYSVLGRHADHMGLTSASSFAYLTFGIERVRPLIELAPRLDLLLPRLLPGSPYTAESIIGANTLFPYFSVFLPAEAAAESLDRIRRADLVPANSQLSITSVVGSLNIRLCDECVAGDRRAGREPYWRRAHQLPGCIVCHVHGCALRDGPPVRSLDGGRFVSVSRALSDSLVASALHDVAHPVLARSVAIISAELLGRGDGILGGDRLPLFYELLRDKGWRNGSRIAASDLMDHVRTEYGPDMLALVGVHHNTHRPTILGEAEAKSTDWLATMLRVRSRARHPLPYVLLMAATGADAAELLSARPPSPEPQDPTARSVPCGNAICPVFDPPVPRPLPDEGNGDIVVIRCPTCGFAYRQNLTATLRRERRIVEYGDLLDDAIRGECERGDASRPELERRLGLSIQTIKSRAQELGVWSDRWGEQTKAYTEAKRSRKWQARHERSITQYQSKWIALAETRPGLGRVALGKLDVGTYSFLRTHAPEWLDEITPRQRATQTAPATREDDSQLAAAIGRAADDLSALSPPTWITRKAIARRMGKGHIRLRRGRWPASTAVLDARTESLADFTSRQEAVRAAGPGDAHEDEAT